MKRNEIDIEEVLRSSPSASTEQMESVRERIFNYVCSNAAAHSDDAQDEPVADLRHNAGWWRFASMTTVAVVLLAAVWVGILLQRDGTFAVLQTADGGLYRVLDGKTVLVRPGERIVVQEVIRANGGAVIALADGSLVEMRSESELSLERANDGLRIRLRKGDVIVNAVKQHRGHLYVQTNDVIVSVVGTVFLVNAEADGSRVAVIEGEVRVQHGGTEESLHRGEQVATTPMIPQRLKEQISWSRNAEAHLALLQQPAGTSTVVKAGSVTGVVLTSSGQPASGFRVAAMRADSVDSFRAMVSLAETDSTGRYQLENVPPGRYYITAGRLDVLTYYPGTLEVNQGLAVLIASATTVSGIDFVIQDSSAVPPPLQGWLSVRPSFRPVVPDGKPRLPEDQIKKLAPAFESLKQRQRGASENQPGNENETETERDKRIKDILDSINAERPFRGAQPESPNGK
jgi:FecR protein/Carboxypeptidase regulatory-like domain